MSSAFRGGVQEGLIWRVGARITHWKLTLVCPKALGPALSPPSQRHPVQMHLQSRANQTNFGPQEMESHTALDTISLPLICYQIILHQFSFDSSGHRGSSSFSMAWQTCDSLSKLIMMEKDPELVSKPQLLLLIQLHSRYLTSRMFGFVISNRATMAAPACNKALVRDTVWNYLEQCQVPYERKGLSYSILRYSKNSSKTRFLFKYLCKIYFLIKLIVRSLQMHMKSSEITGRRCVPLPSFSPSWQAPPAITKCNQLGHSNTRNLLLVVLESRRTKSRCQYAGFLVDISFLLALVKHCAASFWPLRSLVGETHCHWNYFSHSDKVSFLCSPPDR